MLRVASRGYLLLLLSIGCAEVRDAPPAAPECASCHGNGEDGRPPPDLLGGEDTGLRGVGAHSAHLDSPTLDHPLECGDCHVVPETVMAEGHLDTEPPEEGAFVLPGGRTPADVTIDGYDPATTTCSDTYCHARSGAEHPTPQWTLVDGSQIRCGGCHGAPPPAPHPAVDRCALCHPGVDETGDGFLDTSAHLNGEVDVEFPEDCHSCHGRAPDGLPPPDLDLDEETTAIGVGAHVSHVEAGLSNAVNAANCETCHATPSSVLDAGHIDSAAPAEVRFERGLGVTGGRTPEWDRRIARCTDTYCHSGPGAEHPNPKWTLVDRTQIDCKGCHGTPPPPPHPAETRCGDCHLGYSAARGNVDPSTHIDGIVTLPSGCGDCHGSSPSGAPPPDLDGNTGTTFRGVGAHETHLSGGLFGAAVACGECHNVPATVTDAGHLDSGPPADVVFPAGGLARALGASPVFDPGTLTCSGVYCHQTEKGPAAGGARTTPQWTKADGTFNQCGSCHAIPSTAPGHPALANCSLCHPTASGPGVLDPQFLCYHINGNVEVAVTLDPCP